MKLWSYNQWLGLSVFQKKCVVGIPTFSVDVLFNIVLMYLYYVLWHT